MNEILFESIDLSPELARAVSDMNYTVATGIQAGTIPLLMQGLDVIGRSSTGTGKTAAFGIPAVERINSEDKNVQVLVLSPTRELAMQTSEEMRKYAKYKPGVSVASVYGGAPMDAQIRALRTANIVIGTPGRIMDHMRRRTLKLDNLKMVVLDEADEMLNMGFYEDIQTILAQSPEKRQTVLFSATMPPAILKITAEFLKDPKTVDIHTGQRTIAAVEQFFYQVPQSRKMDSINLLLQALEPKRSIIFCNTKVMVDELASYLNERGFKALGIHGDMKQTGRTQVMQSFREGKTRILVATDVAARGIDVDGIESVFNFDIPQEFEYYIHRIGRTGRAGKTGSSHTLVCNYKQMATIRELKRFIKADIQEKQLPSMEEIHKKKLEKFSAKITKVIEAGEYGKWGEQLDSIAAERGCEMRDIACAMAQIIIAKDNRTVPAIKGPVAATPAGRGGKRIVISVDIGRRDRVAPNFIVGAIVDATGLPSRAIGKIDIFDDHTLIEMFETDALTVLQTMGESRVKGRDVRFTLSAEKMRPSIPGSFPDRPHHFADKGGRPIKPFGRADKFPRDVKPRRKYHED